MRFLIHLTGCFLLFLSTAISKDDDRLNIILIMADDLGYEAIGVNGGESYKTPSIDRLAAAGVRFSHCYSQPICTPSRVQIMTGKYNFRNYVAFGKLKRGEKTFAHYLKDAGYTTCIAGKWQLGREKDAAQHFGFDESLLWQHTRSGRLEKNGKRLFDKRFQNPMLERNGVEEDYNNGEFGPDLVTDFICDFIERKKDQPFLVYYPMMLTHCPWGMVPGSKAWDSKDPGSRTYKGDPKAFGGMVTYMDHLVGRIVDHVEQQGLSDKTVIIFTGDNGTDKPIVSKWNGQKYRWGKGMTTDAGTHVPMVASHPSLKKPSVVDDLVNFTDVLPTMCELAGVDFSAKNVLLDGRSFAPQLRGEEGGPRTYSYCWYDKTGKRKSPKVFARTQRYKLYRSGEFFDVKNDMTETNSLSVDQLSNDQKKVRQMLQSVIEKYDKQGA